ncbi:MAG: DUF2163 domain-containing protein [Verrucomicrobia bacterium]|nr:DUF2163 domain-containing protein [Verrucomicrobiota bacterium]
MLFPATILGDLSLRLLLIRPDHSAARPVEVTHRLDTVIGEGRTTIEERRAGRAGLLLAQRVTLTLHGTAADDFRKGTAALGEHLLGVPLWIDALPCDRWAERIYDAQKVVNFDPATGAFEIYDGGSVPGSPPYPLLAPLLIGRWRERPAVRALTSTVGTVDVTVTEASPWSCGIGINAHGSAWTALPDYASPTKDQSQYGLELIDLGGAAREPGLDRRNAAPRWTQEAFFTFANRLAIRDALTWFVTQQGALHAWAPVPAWFQTGADTPQTPDAYTARFASDTLTLSFTSAATATSTIGFVQEIDTGARSQAVPSEVYLYRFTYQHDPANPERYANWDAPVVVAGETYQPAQCVHTEMLLSLRPQDVKAELDVAYIAGSLLADWLVGKLFGRVRLTVERCDPTDVAATRTTVFDGFVRTVLPNGNTLTVTATLFGKLLEKRVPGDVYGPRCNALVFDARCGLVEADHATTGVISPADLAADRFTLTVRSPVGWGGATWPANFFGPNGVLRTGTGRSTQVATILSNAMSGGNIVLKVNRPLWSDLITPGGQTAQLLPGCGGQYGSDCGTKFANQAAFRGFPFMPDYIDQTATSSVPKAKK